jgi:glycerol-3-phosphate dehydrogenase
MIYFPTSDHRICLAYPLENQLVLVGTTDLPTDDPEDMSCSEAEIDYLFRVMAEILPGIRLDRSQIVFRYAGVRPLPRTAPGMVAGAISRDHFIRTFPANDKHPYDVLTLVGGKWTTYRACAAQIADQVLRLIAQHRRIDTRSLKIGGGTGWPMEPDKQQERISDIARTNGLSRERSAVLTDRYGAYAGVVAAAIADKGADGDQPLKTCAEFSRGEIQHIIRSERPTRLADLVLRRTQIGLLGRTTPQLLDELADLMAQGLSWSEDRRTQEIALAGRLLEQRHGVNRLIQKPKQASAGAAPPIS